MRQARQTFAGRRCFRWSFLAVVLAVAMVAPAGAAAAGLTREGPGQGSQPADPAPKGSGEAPGGSAGGGPRPEPPGEDAPTTDLTASSPDPSLVDEVRGQFAGGAERVPVIVQVRVRWRPEAALAAEEARRQRAEVNSAHERAARRVPAARVSRRFDGMPGRVLEVTREELESLAAAPEIATIHPRISDEPAGWSSTAAVGGRRSHQIGWRGTGQNVAILDTGVAGDHEYLAGRIVAEACFSSRWVGSRTFGAQLVGTCPNGQASQTGSGAGAPCAVAGCDHGTHVAGIAAGAETARLVGGRTVGDGVAPGAGIIAVQVFHPDNEDCNSDGAIGPNEMCPESAVADQMDALQWVWEQRNTYAIAAVNMSLAGGQYTGHCDTDPRKAFIDQLAKDGISTVVAAGNLGLRNAIGAPACISTSISVGGTDDSDGMYVDTNASSAMDLWAPGASVLSSTSAPAGYAYWPGTSMAAPHVTGAIALLKQIRQCDPGLAALGPANIAPILQASGTKVTDNRPAAGSLPAGSVTAPRLDIYAALQTAAFFAPNHNFVTQFREISGPEGAVTGDKNRCATKEVISNVVEPHHGGNIGGNSLWYQWKAPVSGLVRFSTAGSTFDTLLAAYEAVPFGLPWSLLMAQNDDAVSGVRQSEISFTATAGRLYLIAVDGFRCPAGCGSGVTPGQPAWGTVTLEWTANRPPNDDFAAARVMSGWAPSTWGDSRRSTAQIGEPSPKAPSVWFKWTAPASGPATVATTGSLYDTVIDVYIGSKVSILSLVATDDDSGMGVTSLAPFTTGAGLTYYIRLRGFNGATGDYRLQLRQGSPGVSVNDVTVKESDGIARFRLSLDGPSAGTTTVNYATSGESATPNVDYTPASGTMTFNPGQLEAWVEVKITSDVVPESTETFRLVLFTPGAGLWLQDSSGTGTILNTTYGAF